MRKALFIHYQADLTAANPKQTMIKANNYSDCRLNSCSDYSRHV